MAIVVSGYDAFPLDFVGGRVLNGKDREMRACCRTPSPPDGTARDCSISTPRLHLLLAFLRLEVDAVVVGPGMHMSCRALIAPRMSPFKEATTVSSTHLVGKPSRRSELKKAIVGCSARFRRFDAVGLCLYKRHSLDQ